MSTILTEMIMPSTVLQTLLLIMAMTPFTAPCVKPLMPARFEVGDPLGLSNRKVVWLVTQSQDSEERRPLNPIQPDIAPTEDPNTSDRAVDDRGAPQIFTLD